MEELTPREIELLNLLIDKQQESRKNPEKFSEVPEIKSTILKEFGFSRYVKMMKEIHFLLL